MGVKIFKLEDFDSDCEISQPSHIFYALFYMTGGNICLSGCGFYNNGQCPCYKKLFKVKGPKLFVMTNKYIAELLNCSKREVSRMRKNGTLPDEYK